MVKMDIHQLRAVLYRVEALELVAKRLHHLDEVACERELTPRQEKSKAKLEARGEELVGMIADTCGTDFSPAPFEFYRQQDPRGCSVYITEKGSKYDYSTEGIAIRCRR